MSTLQNEVLLENIYEEFMVELFETGNDKKMTEDEINSEVIRRFWDYTNYPHIHSLFFYYAYTSTNKQ